MQLGNFRALTFDIIGTLIDYETGVINFLRPRAQATGASPTDTEILEAYAAAEHRQQVLHPELNTIKIFALSWPEICTSLGMPASEAPAQEYAESAKAWQPFPDSIEALACLKQHYLLAAITTSSQEAASRFQQALGKPFTHLYTADLLGYAKPDKRAFEGALVRLEAEGIPRDKILHVAQSQYHDFPAAQKAGLATAWIHRRHDKEGVGGTPEPQNGATPTDFYATSMVDFAEQVKRAQAGTE